MNDTAPKYIVLVNQYASVPETGMGGRHYVFARELARMGHRVDLVMAGQHHLLNRARAMKHPIEIEAHEGFRIIYVRGMRYRKAHSRRRAAGWLLFASAVSRLTPHLQGRPDAVLVSSPSPFAFLGAERLARRHGARLVFEVRDIWPLSLVELGGLSPRHPLVRLMQRVEDRAYRNADRVVSSLPRAVDHMVQRGMDAAKFTWIPTGLDIAAAERSAPLDPVTAKRVPNGFVVAYAGTLGLANALGTLINAADLLRGQSGIAFVLFGDGDDRPRLEERVKQLGLESVVFMGRIEKAQVPAALARCDACFIGWLDSGLYDFGISPNKLGDYLVAGKPVLHSYSGRADPVLEASCGLSVPAGDGRALADAILKLHAMTPAERGAMGTRGKGYVRDNLHVGTNAQRLADVLLGEPDRQ